MTGTTTLPSEITERLLPDDDPALWEVAIERILSDAHFDASEKIERWDVYAQIGACSHWLRPHQTRWTAAGGFAWPSGYGNDGGGYSSTGLPNFDWSVHLLLDIDNSKWAIARPPKGKKYVLRIALPTRTARHDQAAIHTKWIPNFPDSRDKKSLQFYGFRKSGETWNCVATSRLGLE